MESTDCGYLCPHEKGTQRIPVCDQIFNMKADSFPVDIEHFSHLTNKDLSFNSRFNLQRSLSRNGEEKKSCNPIVDNERVATSSPKATSMKSVSIGTNEQQSHHQISIVTTTAPTVAATITATGTPTKSKHIGKRSNSFKQTSIINPRRIVFLFATMSSIGTILLIYFTLSMAKHNEDSNLLDS